MDELLLSKEKLIWVAFGGKEAKKVSVEEFQRQFVASKTISGKLAAALRVLSVHGYCSELEHVPEFWDKRKEFLGQ